jgi:hypothetical protein
MSGVNGGGAKKGGTLGLRIESPVSIGRYPLVGPQSIFTNFIDSKLQKLYFYPIDTDASMSQVAY